MENPLNPLTNKQTVKLVQMSELSHRFRGAILSYSTTLETKIDLVISAYFSKIDRIEDFHACFFSSSFLSLRRKIDILRFVISKVVTFDNKYPKFIDSRLQPIIEIRNDFAHDNLCSSIEDIDSFDGKTLSFRHYPKTITGKPKVKTFDAQKIKHVCDEAMKIGVILNALQYMIQHPNRTP